jgi:hypothetical protein
MKTSRQAVIGAFVVAATVALGPVASAQPGGTNRPWHGSGSGTGTFNTDTEDFVLDGTTIATHLGKSTIHTVGSTLNGGTSVGTITAANGDQLFITQDGPATDLPSSVCPPDLPFASQQSQTFIGGTGRFAGATGNLVVTVCARFDVDGGGPNVILTVTTTSVGTITY